MKKRNWNILCRLLPAVLLIGASCNTARKMNYFNDLPEVGTVSLPPTAQPERVIEKGDRLQVTVEARDFDAASFFNRHTVMAANASTNAPATDPGYLVDPAGMIDMPVLGKMTVTGITLQQLKEILLLKMSPYVKDPLVDVSFTSFRVTVLGEVRGPGTYNLPMQKTTLLEGLAAAGDLLHSAKRYNISLLRDYNGRRAITKFDLRNSDILNNPDVFHLKPNDVIYVQVRPGRIFGEEFSIVATVVTLIVSLVTLGIAVTNN
jgi:polysaccharide biosynthesis/export protein